MLTHEIIKPLKPLFYCRACHYATEATPTESNNVRCNVRAYKTENFNMWRCENCHSINTMSYDNLDKYYENYPFNQTVLNLSYKLAYNKRIKLLKKWGLKKTSAIIDYGCSNGSFVAWLKAKGFSLAYGYDKYVECFSDTRLLNKKYDFFVSYDVIEHLDDPEELIQLASHMLKPGGTLILGTPDAEALHLQCPEDYLMELHPPYHRILFSTQILTELCNKHGLEFKYKKPGFYMDLPIPFLNFRFIKNYVQKTGGFIDVAVEPPHLKTIFKSPKLLLQGLFGYLHPSNTNMTLAFIKQ